ncbi:MAG TPA: isoprenylcysteine carboxylmethyltransferase family protein [Thermoanaerobaculia bacterium]|nr:isoprenylcysteine carboxylmethyltransferase family protein [Thermoanaerobaculia bacterium]
MSRNILAAIWGAWAVGWMVAAVWSARTVKRESAGSRLLVLVLFALGFLPIFNPRALSPFLATPLFNAPAVFDAGVVITILGLGFASWARLHLGRQWSGSVTVKADHELIRSGPYAVVRHPIYTGLLAGVAGTALARATIGAFCGVVLIGVGCLIKIRVEERMMTEQFGDAYRDYRRDVRTLIPFLW